MDLLEPYVYVMAPYNNDFPHCRMGSQESSLGDVFISPLSFLKSTLQRRQRHQRHQKARGFSMLR